jgi:nitrite reductase (NADH) large subunit
VDLVAMGQTDPGGEDDEVVTYSEPARGVYKKLVIRDGRLAGAILLGDGAVGPALQQAFDRGADLPDARTDLLFPGSGAAALPVSAADLPDDAQLCNCNGVSKGRIVEAVEAGCHSLDSVCRSTRAGTGCGSCKGLVRQVVDAAVADLPDGACAALSFTKGGAAA